MVVDGVVYLEVLVWIESALRDGRASLFVPRVPTTTQHRLPIAEHEARDYPPFHQIECLRYQYQRNGRR